MSDRKGKAVCLLSGGLDSSLAMRYMQELGFEIVALHFFTPFCTCDRGGDGCGSTASKTAEGAGVKVKIKGLGQEYLDMMKDPPHGYGKRMNPCLDCRIMMFKKAREVMEEEGAAFVFTGEVLGQRPMSQRRDSMHLIEREAGLKGRVLRPLCAKLLPPTIPEKEGLVDREKLLGISGRGRKRQMELAQELDLNDYPCPSGGCLLTYGEFAAKIKDHLKHSDSITMNDALLTRIGRHFRISGRCKVVVGRNEEENDRIERLARGDDHLFVPPNRKGPIALARGEIEAHEFPMICGIEARYCPWPKDDYVEIEYFRVASGERKSCTVLPATQELLDRLRI